MEKKSFRIIKNYLLPIKSTVEVGPDGILNNGKYVAWKDIDKFCYGILSVNYGTNYVITYYDKQGKRHYMSIVHSLLAPKKKKKKFAEIYEMIHEGFMNNFIIPESDRMFKEIQEDKEVAIGEIKLSNRGIQIMKGAFKREPVFIDRRDIQLNFPPRLGGFTVSSSRNKKDHQPFIFQHSFESRHLFEVLEKMFPEQFK